MRGAMPPHAEEAALDARGLEDSMERFGSSRRKGMTDSDNKGMTESAATPSDPPPAGFDSWEEYEKLTNLTSGVKQAEVYSLLGSKSSAGLGSNSTSAVTRRSSQTAGVIAAAKAQPTVKMRGSGVSVSRAANRARQRVSAELQKQRDQKQERAQIAHDFNALFVSEWLTQHPLTFNYPQPIWLQADCPPSPAGAADASLERIRYLNESGVVHLQEGRLDYALAAFKDMEKAIKEGMAQGKSRLAYLAIAYSNIGGFYFRKGMTAAALQYCERASSLETKAHGDVDFSTKSRLACIHGKGKEGRYQALALCQEVLHELQAMASAPPDLQNQQSSGFDLPSCGGSLLRFDNNRGGAGAALVRGTPLYGAYHAHLAVAYHNYAVQLAQCQELQQASAAVHAADKLAAEALPAKHRWAKQICATVQKLRDLHVSTQFVQHSIRPRLAVFEARQAVDGELSRSTSLPAIGRVAM